MVRIKFIAAASVLALMGACGQQAATQAEAPPAAETPAMPSVITPSAAEFAQLTANSDAYEIQASELAATRAARQEVKDFAAIMVRDHNQTTQQLASWAQTNDMAAPTPAVSAEQQRMIDQLRGLNGEQFDDAYIDQQTEAHEQAVEAFNNYAQNGEAGPLRDWAQNTLPKLREHLTHVEGLDSAT
jgi:putative membrane protein